MEERAGCGNPNAELQLIKAEMGTRSLRASLLIQGLSGIIAQVVLMRELLVSFHGNELTLGIILANWLILVGIGSFVIGKIENVERSTELFGLFQLVFAVAFPLTLYLCRIFRNILLFTPGEGLGLGAIFYSSLLILLPITLPQGALFTCGCRLYSRTIREDISSIGRVYALESTGAVAGGVLVTFFLIQHLHSFEIALIISLTTALVSIFLVWPKPRSPHPAFQRTLWILAILFSLVFAYSLLSQTSNAVHQSSLHSQWRDLNVIYNGNSIYGNTTVTKKDEQFTFFVNGIPTLTTPVPDTASIEDFVHFPMLFHDKPESLLILSGGAGGMIHEILKYPVKRVDYVELDPLLLELVQKFPTPLTQSEISDPRVRVQYTDNRFFVKRTQDRFDLIFVGLSAPQDLQTNRLFTSEFFSVARGKMNPGGIIVLSLPGSLTYISPELRDLNGCILDTLRRIFRAVRVIPGDTTLFLASDSSELDRVTAADLVGRVEKRKIKTSLFNKGYVEFRLHEQWEKWFLESIERREIRINSDFRPVGVFLSLSYWNALFSPSLAVIFKWFEGFSLRISISVLILFTLLMAALFLKRPRVSRQSIPYAIFTTGLSGMIFNLAVIFTFQTFYGYLYHQIGLLIAVFMVGVALSSFTMTQRLEGTQKGAHLFVGIEMAIILFSFLFPFVFSLLSPYLEKTDAPRLVYPLFLIMSFFSGACIGFQFPLASKIYFALPGKEGTLGQTAGLLYGADLLGGFLGGFWGGVLLLPVLGLKESCFMMGLIKISSLALFLIFIKLSKAK
ncbi:MAG TPA: fused MFS/spermidine synthase [Thermodesulfobacteriota bacterium]|nr:fused MFS/spermidine synthase [Thermodesulfobacteriota bacterium]